MSELHTGAKAGALPRTPRTLVGYALALAAPVAATALTLAIRGFVTHMQFFLFIVAVLAAALVGGRGPGLVATVLSATGADLVLFRPLGSIRVAAPIDVLRLTIFVLMSVFVTVLGDLLLKARHNAAAREAALRLSESRYRSLFHEAPIGIYRARTDGTLLAANDAMLEMLGTSFAPGLRVGGDEDLTQASDATAFRRALAGETVTGAEESWRRADGSSLRVRHSARLAMEGGETIVEGAVEDVTEWHLLEQQFRYAQKMDAVGRLAAGVAHDFNNALTTIRGYAALVLDRADDPEMRKDLMEIDRAAETSAAITSHLLAFSRRQVMRPRVVEPGPLLKRLEDMLGRLLGEHVRLEMHIESDLGRVRLDPGQLEQILVNLAINARDAMPDGGTLRVALTSDQRPTQWVDDDRRWVTLTVADDGVGMNDKVRAQAFEPFFTTKPAGRGTGLGLSTVYGIVKQNEGYVALDSEPGSGTVVRVFLPQVEPTPAAAES